MRGGISRGHPKNTTAMAISYFNATVVLIILYMGLQPKDPRTIIIRRTKPSHRSGRQKISQAHLLPTPLSFLALTNHQTTSTMATFLPNTATPNKDSRALHSSSYMGGPTSREESCAISSPTSVLEASLEREKGEPVNIMNPHHRHQHPKATTFQPIPDEDVSSDERDESSVRGDERSCASHYFQEHHHHHHHHHGGSNSSCNQHRDFDFSDDEDENDLVGLCFVDDDDM